MENAEKLIIYGNGAMANVLYSYIKHTADVCGFTVDDVCIEDGTRTFCNLPLAPFSSIVRAFPPSEYRIILAVGFIEMNNLRERKYAEAKEMGYAFARYVHPSVMRHDSVEIEENCIVLDHVSIHPGSRIGRGTFISSNVNIGHDCDIGESNWINSGVAIAGGCTIGARCFFGVNSSTAQEIRVGRETFVAANTFLGKDTKDGDVYLSEPGQRFKLGSKAFLKFSSSFEKRTPET